jgi:hypothetical protein
MLTGTGQLAPVDVLADGHCELKSIVSDLLRYLNAEYIAV